MDAGFAKARAAIGQERILVNCAGTGNAIKTASRDKQTGAIKHFPLDAFDRIIQINLVGTFRCIAKSAAGMLDAGAAATTASAASIVNTASVAAAGRPDRPGGLLGLEGRHRRHDAADRARPDGRRHPRQHHPAGHLRHAAAATRLPEHVKAALAASVPFPKRLGQPERVRRAGR